MRCLCSTSWPTYLRDNLCCVFCCAYTYAKVCVGGAAHMPMHASSVLFCISVCVLPLHPSPTLVFL